MGRPSIYTAELADLICTRLADGESLNRICSDPEMPHERTVRHWAIVDYEGFSPKYAHAREVQAHGMAEELLQIADDARNDWMRSNAPDNEGYDLNGEHVQRSRLRLDTRKWLLSKMLPKVYGERLELEATHRVAEVSGEPLSEEEWHKRQADRLAAATRATTRSD